MNQPVPKKQTTRTVIAYLVVLVVTGVLLLLTKDAWLPMVQQRLGGAIPEMANGHDHGDHSHDGHNHGGPEEGTADENTVELSDQAKRNLNLFSKRAYPQSFWKRTVIPGEIVDRPGLTDRSLASPIAGVITAVHAHEGDIVKPGERLVTVRLASNYLQQAQSDLFRAVRETEIINKEIERIKAMVERGIIAEKRVIQLKQDVERQRSQIDAVCQDLMTRGFSDAEVANVKRGEFLTTLEIKAPQKNRQSESPENSIDSSQNSGLALGRDVDDEANSVDQFFEVQNLVTELGHQIQAGEQIAVLSDHQYLFVRGYAFKREAGSLEQVMRKGWSVGVEFVEDSPENWPNLNQRFKIRNLLNEVDPESRTFSFVIPMENQSRIYEGDERTSVVWRFRPGQRARLQIPVEKIENVFVLPAEAVVRDGAEVYAFQAVGRFCRRFPVHLIYQDRHSVVLANDGSFPIGAEVAQGSAASLNRVLKSQTNEGGREFHVHADGTVHSNSDH